MSEGKMEKTKSVAYPDISAGLPHIGNTEYFVDGKIFRIIVAPPFRLFTAFSQHTTWVPGVSRKMMTNGARWVQNSGPPIVTGGKKKTPVSGAKSGHFRPHFHRSPYSTCK